MWRSIATGRCDCSRSDCSVRPRHFAIAVSGGDHGSAANPERNALLLEKLVRPSLGVWVRVVVGDVSRWLIDAKVDGTVGRAVATLFLLPLAAKTTKSKPTRLMEVCENFVTYRNESFLGHGVFRSNVIYEKDLQDDSLPMLRELLNGIVSSNAVCIFMTRSAAIRKLARRSIFSNTTRASSASVPNRLSAWSVF